MSRPISRRVVLRVAAGIAAAVASGAALAVRVDPDSATPRPASRGATTAGPSQRAAGTVSLGSNASDKLPKQAVQAMVDAFTASTGINVVVNTLDHASFQNGIQTYLQGQPDDVFTWFAGDRMRFFADRGLVSDLTGVWGELGGRYPDAIRRASSGSDGRPFFVPSVTYPWALIHRRELWQRQGYRQPATWSELLALTSRMKADGLVPIAFGDKDGWPAMGFFDILDLRLNGYDFHLRLLGGSQRWTDPRVQTVFERWRELLPALQPAALGRTWQEAAGAMVNGDAAMFFGGTFAGEQATTEQRDDLELFAFPTLGTRYDAERAIDAPINGFMARANPREPELARALLAFLGGPRAQEIYVATNPNYVAVANDADTTSYTGFQRKAATLIRDAGRVAQFFDRDTRPDFATSTGMQSFLQDFLSDPEQDLDRYLARIQDAWDALT